MRLKFIGALLFLLYCSITGWSQLTQPCTTLGQTPQTAFPVCGLETFVQTTVPYCGNFPIPVPGCGNDYGDINPFWYKFTCFASGTLAFTITPNKFDEDYDWQIFDVTGHDVNEVYSNADLFVIGNWAGTYGPTGASASGTEKVRCGSQPSEGVPTFSTLADLVEGHQYLLLVSHFTREPNGYTLAFTGGTALITDTLQPALKTTNINCDAMTITITLNKKVKCASLATDGSDFSINTTAAAFISAQGINCNNSFDMDSLTVKLDKPLLPGKYTLYMKKGSDNSTLLDYCDNPVPVGDSLNFEVFASQPTPFDSITAPGCAPAVIQLVFKKAILCNSISADGSDFTINGTTPVTITGAGGTCSNGVSKTISIQLASPLQQAGSYQVNIKPGLDDNTIIDECGEETTVSSRSFITKDTVSAFFDYTLLYGCKTDTIICTNDGRNGITNWSWNFTGGYTSQARNAIIIYNDYGPKQIKLNVSNGTCGDSAEAIVNLDNELKAAFTISSPFVCPKDKEIFTDASIGKIVSWYWNFGNGITSNLQSPQLVFPAVSRDYNYNVSLTVQNDHNCFETAYTTIKVLYNCSIAVPSAFTPNGDNLNDYLYPLNAYKAMGLEFRVFNRFGQLIFFTKDWTKKWDGTINGSPQPSGTYVWMLSYTYPETGQKYFLRGTSVLIR
ncbi:hypothetical protein BH10BAC2_BH10BAC2_04610 [soil metagenome]